MHHDLQTRLAKGYCKCTQLRVQGIPVEASTFITDHWHASSYYTRSMPCKRRKNKLSDTHTHTRLHAYQCTYAYMWKIKHIYIYIYTHPNHFIKFHFKKLEMSFYVLSQNHSWSFLLPFVHEVMCPKHISGNWLSLHPSGWTMLNVVSHMAGCQRHSLNLVPTYAP